MSRYPNDDVRRFDQQFAPESRAEKEASRAQAELARLRAQVAALEADKAALTTALRPFAEFRRVQAGATTAPYPQSGDWQAISTRQGDAQITIEDLELARATLAAHGTK